jgi:hypothetical protein
VVGLAVPHRPQAEAISTPGVKILTALVVVLLALTGAGCGGDDEHAEPTQAEPNAGTAEDQPGRAGGDDGGPPQESAPRSRPSRRDVEVIRQLERHLRQEAAVESGGWTFADVEDVQVRGTSVLIETDLRPARRDAAASLCLTTRSFFLGGGQGQTPYSTLVIGRGGATLGRC